MIQHNCEVDRVIYGDTLELLVDTGIEIYASITLRLLGVDTHEIDSDSEEEKELAKKEEEFVEEWISRNSPLKVAIPEDDKKDSFGRFLGYILPREGSASFHSHPAAALNSTLLDNFDGIEYEE